MFQITETKIKSMYSWVLQIGIVLFGKNRGGYGNELGGLFQIIGLEMYQKTLQFEIKHAFWNYILGTALRSSNVNCEETF